MVQVSESNHETLLEFAHDILIGGTWVREDAIRELQRIGEISIKASTDIIDEAYAALVSGMAPCDVVSAATAAFEYIDRTSRVRGKGLVDPSMVVDEVSDRAGVSKANAWAVIVGVQNATGAKLDLKKSPLHQKI